MNSDNYKKNKIKNLEEQLINKGINECFITSVYEVNNNPIQTFRNIYLELKKNEQSVQSYNSLELELIKKGVKENTINVLKRALKDYIKYMGLLKKIYEKYKS
ncbi:MAG: hypothetical protein WC376_01420 [Candidatus Nanoarchaeia archaeon]|jgi:cell shape-determining protein MreC